MPQSRPLLQGDPESVGGYRVLGRLGKGGQGVVYLGVAPDGTRAAIKVLDPEWAADPALRQRFQREAAAAQSVASFCTAQVLGADFTVAQPYIVSEYVEGPSLKEQVEQDGPRSGPELHRLAVATATALVAVHEAGIVHRDVKPANVLMGPEGPRVIDFGVAKTVDVTAAQTQSVIGTPGYMAPEQISTDPVSPATDVYAWGAVMVYAATGRAPFIGDSIPAVIHRVMTVSPDLSGLDEPWRSLVGACLAKDPAARPSSDDLLMRLLGRSNDAGAPAPPPPPAPAPAAADGIPTRPHGRRPGAGKVAALIGAVVAVLVVAGTGGYAALASDALPFLGQSESDDGSRAAPAPEEPTPSDTPGSSPHSDTSSRTGKDEAETESKTESEKKNKDKDDRPGKGDNGDKGGPKKGVTFSKEFAGAWAGQGDIPGKPAGNFSVNIKKGGRTATLTAAGGACTWTFTLFRTNDKGGYDGSIKNPGGCSPHKGGGFWIDGGRLVVMLWGEDGNFKEHFFWLDRQ